jgi:hypothetical protein
MRILCGFTVENGADMSSADWNRRPSDPAASPTTDADISSMRLAPREA